MTFVPDDDVEQSINGTCGCGTAFAGLVEAHRHVRTTGHTIHVSMRISPVPEPFVKQDLPIRDQLKREQSVRAGRKPVVEEPKS